MSNLFRSLDNLKLPNKPVSSALSHLLLQLIQPLPHAGEILHLRLVVLRLEPLVGLPVHPL
jgi:hypothetical protein